MKLVSTVTAPRVEVLEDRTLLAAFTFDFDVIASDLHPTLRVFGSLDSSDAPFTKIRYGQGTITSLTDFPNQDAASIDPSDITFQYGSDVAADNAVALNLDEGSFDDGTGDGIVNQFYVPDAGTINTLTVLNDGVAVATGTLLSLEIRTDFTETSTGIGTFRLTSAVGADTTIFDEINALTEGTGTVDFDLGTFGFQGDPFGVGDAARFSSVGNAAFDAPAIGLTGTGPFALAVEGDDYLVRDQGEANAEVGRVATASVTDLFINGSAGNDTLNVDFSGGAFGLQFNGGVGTDTLIINGGNFGTITHQILTPTSGSIDFAGTVVGFTGLEPIIDNSSADNRVFASSLSDDLTITDDGISANNISRLTSTVANGSIDFVNPTSSLIVDGSAENDTLTLSGLDSLFDASVTLNGNGGNDVSVVSMSDIRDLTGLSLNGGNGNDLADIQAVTAVVGIPLIDAEGGDGDDTILAAAGSDANDSSLDDFILFLNENAKAQLNVGNLDVGFQNPLFQSGDTGGTNSIIINGSTDEDILVVDFLGGNPIPDGGVTFNGGSGPNTDGVELENSSFTAITYTFTNASDGVIDLDSSTITFTGLELPLDYGDAPDTGAGTGAGNYQTLTTDSGPGHTIVPGLFLGAAIDGENGTLQNARANADDVDGALPDDEDGVLSPLDLLGTIGTAPSVTLLATNMTGTSATLYGWIDYNRDGVFDNTTERAQVTIPGGTTDVRFTLTFPNIPIGSAGSTYARFRLSTDSAAANPTETAHDGEVEDYRFTITALSDGTVGTQVKVSDGLGRLTAGSLDSEDLFGSSVATLGDLDGDGVVDLVVGARGDENTDDREGAVYVLLMNSDGSVKNQVKISDGLGGLAGDSLESSDQFGSSVAAVGDLDGDGISDLAVGAMYDENVDSAEGAVYVLMMNSDGTVKSQTKISDGLGGLAVDSLESYDFFGSAVTGLGDLDGDGVADLAVGASFDENTDAQEGAAYVLLMNSDGTVKSQTKITDGLGGLASGTLDAGDRFGSSVAALPDLDGDGVSDLAVGASADENAGSGQGAVYVLLMNSDGTVKSQTKISDGLGGLTAGSLDDDDRFGGSLAVLGDLDGDGVSDLAVGAFRDENTDVSEGAVYVLLMNSNGTVKSHVKISDGLGGLAVGSLDASDIFGASLAALGDLNGDGVIELVVGAASDENTDSAEGAIYILSLASLIDYGDAPDTGTGTGEGNYETLDANGGPSHAIELTRTTLFLGDTVDGSNGTLQNTAANADDVDGALPDDEDGVLSPLELRGTIGAAPTVTLLVTNTTGSEATLSGWIDYNQDGIFDNTTERAQTAVNSGTTDGRVTLTFPTIPNGAAGSTYARFRLSTDAAAVNSTGAASDGEVEDYSFAITAPSRGTVDRFLKIASDTNGGPTLADSDRFGNSVANIGDLDGDGVPDLAVGAFSDDTGGTSRGAVHVLLLNSDGTVKNSTKIANETNGGPTLADGDRFGSSVANLGDLDGDGVSDLAVGAYGDDTGGSSCGAVHVLLLNSDGSVKSSTKIASELNGGPTLATFDNFGSSVANLGDLDGDGVSDLAVGADGDDTGGSSRGAVHVLLLNSDGTVKSSAKIANETNGGPTLANSDNFGSSVTSVGDLNGDGVPDLAVGAAEDDSGGDNRGAVHVLLLNSDGTVKTSTKIASDTSGGPTLADGDLFGSSVANLGDLDGDGVPDLAVGADSDDTGGGIYSSRGAVHVLLLNSDGTVKSAKKISSGNSGGPMLAAYGRFGSSVTSVGDLDGDGIADLAVGADSDDTGGGIYSSRGAVHVLLLRAVLPDYGDAPDSSAGTGAENYQTTEADGGPSHEFLAGLLLGASVDGDSGSLQNVAANADDLDRALPDDEDGVIDPLDLRATIGTAPNVTLAVTNVTGNAATLSGWIDYNQDGVFDNTTERTQTTVATGTTDGRVTLTFPTMPDGSTGTTYARFRLSTDMAAQNSTGPASDGEVEDYVFTITGQSSGTVDGTRSVKISDRGNDGGPLLDDNDVFGEAVEWLGDLDGDGVDDLAVGAIGDDTGGINRGAVLLLFRNSDGTVKRRQKIAGGLDGGPDLANNDLFGGSIASLGDLDGDGVADLAIGAIGDDTGGSQRGAIHILFLNNDGTIKSSQKIANETGGGPTLADFDYFGRSVTSAGDLDGDGVTDLAVGADGDDTGGSRFGAIHVLFMNSDGTVKSSQKVASDTGGGPTFSSAGRFGSSLTSLGDLDDDGVDDLAVGARFDSTGGFNRGAVYVLFLNDDGTVKNSQTITSGVGGGPVLSAGVSGFGGSIDSLGDLDGDGVTDLGVGVTGDDTGGINRGAMHVLFLNSNGTVKASHRIASGTINGPDLSDRDYFGTSVSAVNDLDGDGLTGLAVGATGDDGFGIGQGAVHVLYLNADGTVHESQKISSDASGNPVLVDKDFFGRSVASIGDLDGDGIDDLAVGASGDSFYRGAVHVLFMNGDGTVRSSKKIASDRNGGPTLTAFDQLGRSVTSLGDLDGDGINDLAVGASGDDTGYSSSGAVYTLFLNRDGSVRNSQKIASETGGGPLLPGRSEFGTSVASPGDLNGDGVSDLIVGSPSEYDGKGAAYVLFLKPDGSVKATQKINQSYGGGPVLSLGDSFGSSVTSLGDLDGDGVTDIAVGASGDDTGANFGSDRGAVYVLFLNADGTARSTQKIASGVGGAPPMSNGDAFGSAVTFLGDLDGDGTPDMAVGELGDNTGGPNRGAVHVLFMNSDGTVRNRQKLANGAQGVPQLADFDVFGSSVALIGDLNGDGIAELAVGASGDDTGGDLRGAVHVLFLNALDSTPQVTLPTDGGNYEVRRDGEDLLVRVAGVAELFRQRAATLTQLTIVGSSEAEIVTVLNTGEAVSTPLSFVGAGGADQFDGSLATGPTTLDGGEGNDTLTGGGADDLVTGGAGNNQLTGGGGTDTLRVVGSSRLKITALTASGDGEDTHSGFEQAVLEAGASNNRLDASAATFPVTLLGGAGNDTLLGGSQNDSLDGGAGADFAEITGTNIVLTDSSAPGFNGDVMTSVEGVLLTASGRDSVINAAAYTRGPVTIVGSAGDDTLTGSPAGDLILAGAGADVVSGGTGDDVILGNAGSDTLSGEDGNDTLIGGRGRDSIDGGLHSDLLLGGGGRDTVSGGGGSDRILGGGGRDLLDGDDGDDTLFGGPGRDDLAGGLGADTLNRVFRDDAFSQQVGPDFEIGGQRPAPRPAPVSATSKPDESAVPSFKAPQVDIEDIDSLFEGSLLPELLEL